MVIMDAHVHLKNRNQELLDVPALLKEMDDANVSKVFLFPGTSFRDATDKMLDQIAGHEDRFIPFAFLDPHVEGITDELERLITKRGVKGLKLHPVKDAFPADRGYLLDPLLEIIDKYHLHVIMHCTSDAPNSSPLQFERTAKRWPNVTFQMAHMGGCWLSDDAIMVALRNNNIYLETSTVSITAVKRAIAACPEKVLMGTDVPFYKFELEQLKMRLATDDSKVFEMVMGGNMAQLIEKRGL